MSKVVVDKDEVERVNQLVAELAEENEKLRQIFREMLVVPDLAHHCRMKNGKPEYKTVMTCRFCGGENDKHLWNCYKPEIEKLLGVTNA